MSEVKECDKSEAEWEYEIDRIQDKNIALALCDKILAVNPLHDYIHDRKINLLINLKLYQDALSASTKRVEHVGYTFKPLMKHGYVLGCLNRHEEAADCYERAISIEPTNANAYNNLGFALNCLGRHKESIEIVNVGIGLAPKDGLLRRNRGVALFNLKEYKSALTDCEFVMGGHSTAMWHIAKCFMPAVLINSEWSIDTTKHWQTPVQRSRVDL